MPAPNWKNADLDLIKAVVSAAEARLAAQVQLAISADSRATLVAAIYVAIAMGVLAAVAAGVSYAAAPAIFAGGLVAIAAYLLGAYLCVRATLPVRFWTPGNEPEEWYKDVARNRDLKEALGELAENYNANIAENDATLDRNAGSFRIGTQLGMGAPFLGAGAAIIVHFLLTGCGCH